MPTFQKIHRQFLTGERALFHSENLEITDSTFADGESPLKESRNIRLLHSMFKWKYPLWYCHTIDVQSCTLFDTARAGIWYSDDVSIKDTVIEAPKNLRRCRRLTLENVDFPNAAETLWSCDGVTMKHITAKGDYFAMNSKNMTVENLRLSGNYSFDGAEQVEIRNSVLLTKDAFWNSNHVTVYDSFVSGEYLGWNSKNLTLINCTIESLQGMCYIENLVMKNCKLLNTTLAFEYSDVEAEIDGGIDSVLNPKSGSIRADEIRELILEPDKIDPSRTTIICHSAQTV